MQISIIKTDIPPRKVSPLTEITLTAPAHLSAYKNPIEQSETFKEHHCNAVLRFRMLYLTCFSQIYSFLVTDCFLMTWRKEIILPRIYLLLSLSDENQIQFKFSFRMAQVEDQFSLRVSPHLLLASHKSSARYTQTCIQFTLYLHTP